MKAPLRCVLLLGSFTFAGSAAAGGDLPAATFTGRVVTPAGEPAAGAAVFLEGWDGERFETTSGADGWFTLTGLPVEAVAHRYLANHAFGGLVAVPAGWGERTGSGGGEDGGGLAPGLLPVLAPLPGRAVDVGDLPLSPGTVHRGRAVGSEGEPLAGAAAIVSCRVRYMGGTVNEFLPEFTVPADADGRFTTPPLPTCAADLTITAPGRRPMTVLPTPDGSAASVTLAPITLAAESPATLEVTDAAGTPIDGASVKSFPLYRPSTTDAAGRVRLPGLDPRGPLQTLVAAKGFRSFRRAPREELDPLPDGTRLFRVELERSRRLTFRVTDAATGEPVEVDSVVVCVYERGAAGVARLVGCTNAAVERPAPGTFAVEHQGAWPYHLEIRAAGYTPSDVFLDPLPTDADHEVGPFTLTQSDDRTDDGGAANRSPKVAVSGTVAPTGGADPAGALVTLWKVPRSAAGAANAALAFGRLIPNPPRCVAVTVADANGRFQLDVLRAGGDFLLRADAAPAGSGPVTAATRPAPAVAPVSVPAGLAPEAVTLAPTAAGSIRGLPDESSIVRGSGWAVAFDDAGFWRAVPLAADGSFVLAGLPPGRYGVKAGRLGGEDREAGAGALPINPSPADAGPPDPWRRATRASVEPGAAAEIAVSLTD